jgi:hypothetical protein
MSTPATPVIETIYEHLALGIDRAAPANEALFLAKLALALGHQLGDAAIFHRCIEMALVDLPLVDLPPSKAAGG